MDRATLRSKLMARVEKHDGHWHWIGQTNSDGLPVLGRGYGAEDRSARQVVWELFRPGGARRLIVTCDESDCIAPDHLKPWDNCPRGHDSERYPTGQCKECQRLAVRRKVACPDCGKLGAATQQARHRKTCKGPAATTQHQQHRSPADVQLLIEEVHHLSAFGVDPEDIATRFDTSIGALEILLRRRGRQDLSNYLTRRRAA